MTLMQNTTMGLTTQHVTSLQYTAGMKQGSLSPCKFKVFVEVPDHWTKSIVDMFMNQLRYKVWKQHRDSLVSHELVTRKKFLGFRNNRKYKFIQLSFHSKRGMNQYMKGLAEKYAGLGLQPGHVFPLHETNIDPMLRFMHLRDLQACGWLKVPDGKYYELEVSTSTCNIACLTSWKHVELLEKAAIAPVVVASFDIEADSSHGDFPSAKKRYHKLARELAETGSELPLIKLISLAFSEHADNPAGISPVFTKFNRKPAACSIEAASGDIKSKKLLHSIQALQDAKDTKIVPHSVRRLLRQWYDAKKGCVVYEGCGQAIQRNIQELTGVLDKHLPPLEGDHVIQIGTTITVYGQKDCVKRHIITLGSCDPLPGIDVESYDTEKEVLLAWSRFITELDPDVITGWHTFGFDNKFMWERAEELACVYDFGKLGRVKGLSEKLFEKKLASSALGDNTYYILPMKGRVQIDLLKAVQNNPSFKMDSYKLDNVASTFMRGPLKETKLLDSEQPGTRVVTSSTEGLKEGGWITLVKNNGIIEEPYADTGKLQIHQVTANSFEVDIELGLEPGIKYSWCESKDDVSAADIFRLQKGSSTDRALVAKYCVQDCELVGRLFDKLSMLPNNLAMGNVCNVPFGYLFLRGQGVKIFSLVSKQCRQDGYIMPVIRPPPEAPPESDSSSTGDDVEQVVEKYEGAIVLDPIPDVHYDPVAVSDFNS